MYPHGSKLFGGRFGSCAFDRSPFQIDLCSRISHLGAESKRVYSRDLPVDGVVADIAESSAFRKGSGDSPDNKFRLIHAGVVGPDIPVGLV